MTSDTNFETNNYMGILGLMCLTKRFFITWVLQVLKLIPIIGEYRLVVYYVFIAILILLSISTHKCVTRLPDIILLIFSILSWLISSLYIENSEFLQEGFPIFWVRVIPYYYIAKRFDFNSEINIFGIKKTGFNWLYLLSIIGVAANTLYFVNPENAVMENSGASTNTLICVCYLIFYAFFNRNIVAGIFSVVGSLAMIAYAVRTNMVVIFVMVILMVLLNIKKSKYKAMIIAAFSTVFGLIYANFEAIILALETMFLKIGISNKFFDLFHSTEGIGYLSNRERIWARMIEKINERPFLGYGIFGDRHFFNNFNGYSHNMFLEIWIDYGIFIGTIILLIIFAVLIKGFIVTKNRGYDRGLILCLACSEIVMLLVSGSYLVEGPFFFLIGFAVKCIRENDAGVTLYE